VFGRPDRVADRRKEHTDFGLRDDYLGDAGADVGGADDQVPDRAKASIITWPGERKA
jgi:hypothetical protein